MPVTPTCTGPSRRGGNHDGDSSPQDMQGPAQASVELAGSAGRTAKQLAKDDGHISGFHSIIRDLTFDELAQRWWRPVLAVTVVALAVVWRLVRQDVGAPPNLELVTAATFFAALLLRHPVALLVPFAVAVVSDAVLGNTAVLLFTWTAWPVIGLAALFVRRTTGWRRLAAAVTFGAGSSVWFFLWTNAGVWFLGRGSFYPAGIDGLMASYTAGLPFFRTMLLGNLVLVPIVALAVTAIERMERAGAMRVVHTSAGNSAT